MKKNIKSGFSIAELLITMLIVLIIGTALVPVIGPRKIKDERPKIVHGVYECYWNGNQLYEYRRNDTNNRRGTTAPVSGNYCTVNLPDGNFYEVTLIGAGGKGFTNVSELSWSPNSGGTTIDSGVVHLTSFNSDLHLKDDGTPRDPNDPIYVPLQNLVHEFINARHYAQYEMKSYIGRSGHSACARYFLNSTDDIFINNQCSELCGLGDLGGLYRSTSCPDECSELKQANGGNSGEGRNVNVLIPFGWGEKAEYTDDGTDVTAKVGDKYYTLTAAGAGGDASCSYADRDCTAGENSTENTQVISNGYIQVSVVDRPKHTGQQGIHEYENTCNYENEYMDSTFSQPRRGSVELKNNDSFSWAYTGFTMSADVGTAGTPGQEMTQSYPRLNGTIYLYPAKKSSGGFTTTFISSDAQGSKKIIETEPFIDGSNDNYIGVSVNTIPIDEQFKNQATVINSFKYREKLRSSNALGGLYAMCENGNCPGYATSGAFPYIEGSNGSISGNGTLRVQKGTQIKEATISVTTPNGENPGCPDGFTRVNGTNGAYCRANDYQASGQSGAIIIIW